MILHVRRMSDRPYFVVARKEKQIQKINFSNLIFF